MEPAEVAAWTRRWLKGAPATDIVIVLKAIQQEARLQDSPGEGLETERPRANVHDSYQMAADVSFDLHS